MLTTSTLSMNGGSGFRIGRPMFTTTGGFVTAVDPTAAAHLAELNDQLGKRIFSRRANGMQRVGESAEIIEIKDDGLVVEKIRAGNPMDLVPDLDQFLTRQLTPKHIAARRRADRTVSFWAADSLLDALSQLE